jgi:iron complex outermembrane receptor protein
MQTSNKSWLNRVIQIGLILAYGASPSLLFADQSTSTTSATSQNSGALEEVIVTARRKEENLQTVPIAITAFSQAQLNQNNIESVQDLQYYVPSLSETGQRRDAMAISIRGQGSSGYSSLPGVLIYLNEVPTPVDDLGQSFTGPGTLFDLENVQVLKGPQGTLFGRNAIGGAVLLQSKRPTNDVDGSVEVGYGNYNNREVLAIFNAPISTDTVLFRIALKTQERDGFTRSLGDPDHPNGTDLDNVNYIAGRATITFRPNDSFQNDLIYDGLSSATHGTSVLLDNVDPNGALASLYPSILGILAQQQALGIRTQVPLDTDIFSNSKNVFLTDILRQNFTDTITLRNIIGYRQIEYSYGIDFDGTSLPILDFGNVAGQKIQQFTEEAQLQGKSFGGTLDWVAGAFYLSNPPQDYSGNDPATQLGGTSYILSRIGDDSKALYLQGTQDLGSLVTGLKVTAGFRYTWDQRYLQSLTLPADGICPGPAGPFNSECTLTNSGKWSAPTWTFSLDYQVTPQTLLYATTRRGYRSGGFNQGVTDPSLANFAPETVTDVELGVKSDFSLFGLPTRINADGYHQSYDNIQVNQFVFAPGDTELLHITQNAATARLWGAEFEQWTNIGEHLQLGLNFDYVNLRYTSFAQGVTPGPLIGQETANRPPYKYGVNARYNFAPSDSLGSMSVWGNWTWQDKNGDASDVGGEIPSFGLLTLGGSWNAIARQPIDASFYVTNALNKTYIVQAQSLYSFGLGAALASYGEPRMYGVRFRYHFGRTE